VIASLRPIVSLLSLSVPPAGVLLPAGLCAGLLVAAAVAPGVASAQSTAGPSASPTRVLIDTDANNELDDQHALAYALLSGETFRVEGITVNRTDNGGDIEAQMAEARRVVRLTGLRGEVPVLEGASGAYDAIAPTVDRDDFDGAEAVNFIIEQAHASGERPLVVVPIGKLTNVALALEKDPSIADEMRVVWLGSNFPEPGEYNLENDPSAVTPVIESGVPFEIAVVRYGRSTGTFAVQTFQSEVRTVMPGLGPEVETPVTGRHGGTHTTFGDYSVALFDHVDQSARALYDVAAVAVVKNPAWATRRNAGPYRLEDGAWVRQDDGPDLVIWELFYGAKILQDFFGTLRDPVPAVPQ
jgi:inosine-uridine nucleoside N-ribohydrolase